MATDPIREKLEAAADRADAAAQSFVDVLKFDKETPVPVEGGEVDSMAKRIYDQVSSQVDALTQAAVDAENALNAANSAVVVATDKAQEAAASSDAASSAKNASESAKSDAQSAASDAAASSASASASALTATSKADESSASALSAASSKNSAKTSEDNAALSAAASLAAKSGAEAASAYAVSASAAATASKNEAIASASDANSASAYAESMANAASASANSATSSAAQASSSASSASASASVASSASASAVQAKDAAEAGASSAEASSIAAQSSANSAASVLSSMNAYGYASDSLPEMTQSDFNNPKTKTAAGYFASGATITGLPSPGDFTVIPYPSNSLSGLGSIQIAIERDSGGDVYVRSYSGTWIVFSKLAKQSSVDTKVDKVAGMGLSDRSFTQLEKDKLSAIAAEATKNQTDAYLLSRANHTGTQAISTVTSLQSSLDSKAAINSPSFTGSPSAPNIRLGNVASADVTTLDFYEEGSFNPTFEPTGTIGTITYGTRGGSYTRIGNVVFWAIIISVTAFAGNTGGMRIGGLPFVVASGAANSGGVSIGYFTGIAATNIAAITGTHNVNAAAVVLYKNLITGGNSATLTTADVSETFQIRLAGVYRAG